MIDDSLISPGMLGLMIVLAWMGLTGLFMSLIPGSKAGTLRPVSTFTRMKRALSLAVERGVRIHLSLGRGGLNGQSGMSGVTGLAILDTIMMTTGSTDEPLTVTSGDSTLEILSQKNGQIDGSGFASDSSQLSGLTSISFAAGTLPVVWDDQTAVNILTGHFGVEAGLMMDANQKDSVTIAGTDSLPGQAVMFAMADFPMVGEEIFAANAYLRDDPQVLSSLCIQDIGRWGIILAIVVGIILSLMEIV